MVAGLDPGESSKTPELIVMLTQNDRTVADAAEVFDASRTAPAKCWGLKDVGVSASQIRELVRRLKGEGKLAFLEVVRYSEAECLESAALALECGFDYLMGTVYYPSVGRLVKGQSLKYLPFAGKVSGSPSVLEGTVADIVEDAKGLVEKGVDGFDLPGYRCTGDAEELITEFLRAVRVPVVLAGSIDGYEKLDRVKEFRPWGFTIGSAFFARKFGSGATFREQIERAVEYLNGPA